MVGILIGMSVISLVELIVIIGESLLWFLRICSPYKIRNKHIGNTSVHGLRQVGRPESLCGIRLFWLVVFLAAFGAAVFGLVGLLTNYWAMPKNVAVSV